MILTVQESKATIRAAAIMLGFLKDGGPQPAGGWREGEQQKREAEIRNVLSALRKGLYGHHNVCVRETRCIHHSVDYTFEQSDISAILDCLHVAHVVYMGKKIDDLGGRNYAADKHRYEVMKQIRTVIYKATALAK